MNARPLASCGPFLIAANVRGRIDHATSLVIPGCGHPGDLVIGRVEPPTGTRLTVFDSDRKPHRVSEPCSIIAVLGTRDSSTHVCATIPAAGLPVEDGTRVHWVAGESGIVGCLEREPAPDSLYRPEHSAPFRCTGLVADADGVINVQRFAVRPRDIPLSTPVVIVAATSSEAGKTVLTGELIRRLVRAGHRVAAIKATGTGGVLDSLYHAECGAVVTLDQVDAGLITTHGDAEEVGTRIPLLFRAAEQAGVDIIIAELGGDLVSANNPVLFSVPELVDQTRLMLVIANDALAAAGVVSVNESRLRFPNERIRFLSSPFRNHAGMSRRMAAVGISSVSDPRSAEDLDRLATEIAMLPGEPVVPRFINTGAVA